MTQEPLNQQTKPTTSTETTKKTNKPPRACSEKNRENRKFKPLLKKAVIKILKIDRNPFIPQNRLRNDPDLG
jgi:hypothetical protein